jgi:hypothetical protein
MTDLIQVVIVTVVAGGALALLVLPKRLAGRSRASASPGKGGCPGCGTCDEAAPQARR